MRTFKEFMDKEDDNRPKLWSATKREIVDWWTKLKANQPIMADPIPHEREGSTYGWDGIRITGSQEFIASVMSRFKDFIYQENPSTKLRLAFRQVEAKYTQTPDDKRFVFYANVAQRAPKKIKSPKIEL